MTGHRTHCRWIVHVLLLAATGLMLWGCSPPKYMDREAFVRNPRPVAAEKPYVIEPPDTIQILAPAAPEVDQRGARIRPDGYIPLPLLGDIFAAGYTPAQLGSIIEEKLLTYYQDVDVQVDVTGFNSKVYYMAGELSQGPRGFTGKDDLLDVVLRAGIRRSAWPEHLVVLRPNEDGELIRRITINFRDLIEKGELKNNIVIEEGDIVFMPINPLAAIGVFVSNLTQPVQPVVSLIGMPARVPNQVERAYDNNYNNNNNNNR